MMAGSDSPQQRNKPDMSPWRKPTSNATTRIATFGRSASFYEPFTLANHHLTTTNRATKNGLVQHTRTFAAAATRVRSDCLTILKWTHARSLHRRRRVVRLNQRVGIVGSLEQAGH
jgi:hypothetical protein